MTDPDRPEITEILNSLREGGGDQAEMTDRIFEAVFDELRRLAADLMRHERSNHTLQATALVNEAYLRLVGGAPVTWENRAHFFGIAARAMRRILVEHARRRARARRGGGWQRLSLTEDLELSTPPDVAILDLERVLSHLSTLDQRLGRVVELRVFGGLTIDEAAHVLGISPRTVQEDWRVAKMWLARDLSDRGTA